MPRRRYLIGLSMFAVLPLAVVFGVSMNALLVIASVQLGCMIFTAFFAK